MRFLKLAVFGAAAFLMQSSMVNADPVAFVGSPCAIPPSSSITLNPSLTLDLTSAGMDQIANAVQASLRHIAQYKPGTVLVPLIQGSYPAPLGNILYNVTNVQITDVSIDSVGNSLDVENQVTHLMYQGINASIALDYSFVQDNFLKLPKGHGSAVIHATGGQVLLGIGNYPGGVLKVDQSACSFDNFDIKVDTTFGFLINLLLSAFKSKLTSLINKDLQTKFATDFSTGLNLVHTLVPRDVVLLKAPYTMDIQLGYATPLVSASSIRQSLELEFAPKTTNSTVISSCASSITRNPVPSFDQLNADDAHMVATIPESTVNSLFWTLYQNEMLTFTVPASHEFVLSTFFPDHPCDLHVEAAQAPVIDFNQDDSSTATVSMLLKYTAVETKSGKPFSTFTATNTAKVYVSLKNSELTSTGYVHAAITVKIESVAVSISNLQFFGLSVPDWMASQITSKLSTVTGRAVEETVNLALADGIPVPLPPLFGISDGKFSFANHLASAKLQLEVLQ